MRFEKIHLLWNYIWIFLYISTFFIIPLFEFLHLSYITIPPGQNPSYYFLYNFRFDDPSNIAHNIFAISVTVSFFIGLASLIYYFLRKFNFRYKILSLINIIPIIYMFLPVETTQYIIVLVFWIISIVALIFAVYLRRWSKKTVQENITNVQ